MLAELGPLELGPLQFPLMSTTPREPPKGGLEAC